MLSFLSFEFSRGVTCRRVSPLTSEGLWHTVVASGLRLPDRWSLPSLLCSQFHLKVPIILEAPGSGCAQGMCSKGLYHIVSGSWKLVSHFNAHHIWSWADRRLFSVYPRWVAVLRALCALWHQIPPMGVAWSWEFMNCAASAIVCSISSLVSESHTFSGKVSFMSR